jgi:hypothetical protein
MSVLMTGNFIFVRPGEKMFKVASNFTNYLELGAQGVTGYYLEAKIEKGDFLINATLLDAQGKIPCRIVNNFPERSGCRKDMTPHGFRIFSSSGQLLLAVEAPAEVCFLRGSIYDEKGEIVAQDVGDDFLIYHGPAVLGKSGNSLGIVLA